MIFLCSILLLNNYFKLFWTKSFQKTRGQNFAKPHPLSKFHPPFAIWVPKSIIYPPRCICSVQTLGVRWNKFLINPSAFDTLAWWLLLLLKRVPGLWLTVRMHIIYTVRFFHLADKKPHSRGKDCDSPVPCVCKGAFECLITPRVNAPPPSSEQPVRPTGLTLTLTCNNTSVEIKWKKAKAVKQK